MKGSFTRRQAMVMAAAGLAVPAAASVDIETLRAARLKYGVPALGAMVVGPDGVLSLGVDGVRQVRTDSAVTETDRWHLGSNAKAMTAVLYALLVQAGVAKWGLTLAETFPAVKRAAAWDRVTIEGLLSHHSGVSDSGVMTGAWLNASRLDERPLSAQRAAVAEEVLRQTPAALRGTFQYANLNYVVAGAVMERLTGQPWEELMRKHVFAPIGMTDAGFGAPQGDNAWGHAATLLGFGPLRAVVPDVNGDNPLVLGPAGTVHMSLASYANFLSAFIAPSNVLTPESIEQLTKPRNDQDPSYALGWARYAEKQWAKGQVLAHEGSNTMWHALTLVAPARQRAIVCVCNEHVSGQNAVQELSKQLVDRL
jgi:D-alanyl-D-alanine carboxypeptidase